MSEIYIVDSHCHLDYLDKPIEAVREMANELGVKRFMTIAVEEGQWQDLQALGEASDIDVALGIHPCDVVKAKAGWEDRLLEAAKSPVVVAIGETGLDNYHDATQKKAQQAALEAHAYIATTLDKPLVIHMREATDEVLKFLKSYKGRGILHCFSEDYETAKIVVDQGMLISLSGTVTFKNAAKLHEVATKLPLEHLLLETDSPFLAPVPYRGKKNYPAYTRYVAEAVAKLKGASLEEVAQVTTNNYLSLTQK